MDDFLPNKLNAKISNFSGGTLRSTRNSLQNYLFRSSEPGFTFEPWDISTLYQDRAGTTPVTAVGQSVGLRLDKSKGLALGAELVTNGDNEVAVATAPLDTLTNFTAKVRSADFSQGGTYSAKLTANSTSGSHYWNLTNVAAGVTLRISGWVYVPTGATAGQSIKLVDIFDGSFIPEIVPNFGKYDQWVYFSAIRPAKATAWALALGQDTAANWAGGSIYVDGLSIKTLAGNHEVAINDAARGVYGREPETGTRNRLTYTEQFDNAAWSKTASTTVTANAVVAPDGTTTADTVTSGSAAGYIYPSTTIFASAGGAAYTYSIYAKAGTATSVQLLVAATATYTGTFNLSTGVASTITPNTTVTMVDVGGGWYRCVLTCASVANTVYTEAQIGRVALGLTFSLWGAQLELGASATAYQKVVSQYDVTEAGVASCYYVQTDGVDDAYVTPTITPGTDKVQVFAGVRKNSDAAIGMVVEFSANVNSNNGTFWMAAPIGAGVANYDFASKGTIGRSKTRTGFAAPITNVLTGIGDISGDIANLRVNGNDAGATTIDQGTGNYLAYPAYIYARGGTTLPFNGRDYGHAVRFGPNLDAATIARVEALIARNTPTVTL